MSKKILDFNIPNQLPDDYDPILGRKISDVADESSTIENHNDSDENPMSSVFDTPEIDYAYQNNITEEPSDNADAIELTQVTEEVKPGDTAETATEVKSEAEAQTEISLDNANQEETTPPDNETSNDIATEGEELPDNNEDKATVPSNTEETVADVPVSDGLSISEPEESEEVSVDLPQSEPINEDKETTEITPQEETISPLRIDKVQEVAIEKGGNEPDVKPVINDAEILKPDLELDSEVTPFETMDGNANSLLTQAEEEDNLSPRERLSDDEALDDVKDQIIEEVSETLADNPDDQLKDDVKEIAQETTKFTYIINKNADSEKAETAKEDIKENLADQDAQEAAKSEDIAKTEKPEAVIKPKRKKRRKKSRQSVLSNALFLGGIVFTGLAILLLASTLLSSLGVPFSNIATYAPYWVALSVIGGICWGILRNKIMIAVSVITFVGYLFYIVPWLGEGPKSKGGLTQTIGWANVENNPEALSDFINQANENQANLLIIAGANKLISGNIPDWSLIQTPILNDPTSLVVLSKGGWRSLTVPGEPTIARPLDNGFTIIGVNPSLEKNGENAVINRAANRIGDQQTPVVAIGDFGLAPWSGSMRAFSKTSGAKRVKCGGILGNTNYSGIFGTPKDHAYNLNAQVSFCKTGSLLNKSHHKPLFLGVTK